MWEIFANDEGFKYIEKEILKNTWSIELRVVVNDGDDERGKGT